MRQQCAEEGSRAKRGRQPSTCKPSTLKDLGVSEQQPSRWQKVAEMDEDQFEAASPLP